MLVRDPITEIGSGGRQRGWDDAYSRGTRRMRGARLASVGRLILPESRTLGILLLEDDGRLEEIHWETKTPTHVDKSQDAMPNEAQWSASPQLELWKPTLTRRSQRKRKRSEYVNVMRREEDIGGENKKKQADATPVMGGNGEGQEKKRQMQSSTRIWSAERWIWSRFSFVLPENGRRRSRQSGSESGVLSREIGR